MHSFFIDASTYFCICCDISGSFEKIVRHRIKYHYHEQLRIHRKVLSDQSGKKIRQELYFGYIPADISNNGMELKVDPIAEDIKIVHSNKKIVPLKPPLIIWMPYLSMLGYKRTHQNLRM